MKTHYKVKLLPNPLIIRVENEREEVIFGNDKYISIKKAENIAEQLNNGITINFDNLK